jgi:hypothetical protein
VWSTGGFWGGEAGAGAGGGGGGVMHMRALLPGLLGACLCTGVHVASHPLSLHYARCRLYLPRPPYEGLQYKAYRAGSGYNFAGLLLGPGGSTLQKIQRASGAGGGLGGQRQQAPGQLRGGPSRKERGSRRTPLYAAWGLGCTWVQLSVPVPFTPA